ncbi:hypothetical protein AVEN_62605-1, partial [Araneus ventricosus]
DADENLDPEDLDNEECVICSEQRKTELGFHCFARKLLVPPVLAGTKSKPMAMQFL